MNERSRRLLGALAALTSTTALACGSSSAVPATATTQAAQGASGISGRVLLSPTCPVQGTGQTCERGYQTTIAIYTAAHQRFVKTFRSERNGAFRVVIAPGRYVLTATQGSVPRLMPSTVTVRRGRFTSITLVVDSGIR
jgi:hypothetical protein